MLLDAFLLDPWRDPNEVWITIRNDGVFGSGTQSDPWNATPRATLQIDITSIRKEGTTTAVVTTAKPHNFSKGDLVTIMGVKTSGDDYYYGGTFKVDFVVGEKEFIYEMSKPPTTSPLENPDDESEPHLRCWRERETFDHIMRDLVEPNTTVHLGPGIYETKGAGLSGAWQVRPGLRIIGAGIGLTTLKLVNASAHLQKLPVIGQLPGTHLSHGFEASDFSIDCNIRGQDFPEIETGAAIASGSHVRFHRLRAINFGTQSIIYLENYVFYTVVNEEGFEQDDPCVNQLIEECICEYPSVNNTADSFMFLVAGGGERGGTDTRHLYSRGCAVRNCYADASYLDEQSGKLVSSLAVALASDANNPPDPENGIVKVDPGDASDRKFKLTTRTPHLRNKLRDTNGLGLAKNINLAGVLISGTDKHIFNGVHEISNDPMNPAIDEDTQLIFELRLDPDPLPDGFVDVDWENPALLINTRAATVGVPTQGLLVDGGTAAVAEGNRLFNITLGGPYQDTHSSRDWVARDNWYHNCGHGPVQNRGGLSPEGYGATLLIESLAANGTLATLTTKPAIHPISLEEIPVAHNLKIGEAVKVQGVLLQGVELNPFNGLFYVESVIPPQSPNTSSTQFTYRMKSAPGGGSIDVSGAGYGRLWQVGRIVAENNLIEVPPSPDPEISPPNGIVVRATPNEWVDLFVYHNVVARHNLIGIANGQSGRNPVAIEFHSVEKGLIENNILSEFTRGLNDNDQGRVRTFYSGSVRSFNNRDGQALVPAYNRNSKQRRDDLELDLEEALMLALL